MVDFIRFLYVAKKLLFINEFDESYISGTLPPHTHLYHNVSCVQPFSKNTDIVLRQLFSKGP